MTTSQPLQEEQELLHDIELNSFVEASRTQRFFNLLIDIIFMQYGVGLLTGYLLLEFLLIVSPHLAYSWFGDTDGFRIIPLYVIGMFNYLLYYTICEKSFKGYTLGKLITGTRAIREDGQELSFKDALLRSLVRLVPFEHVSGFDYPWHDTWTNTMVIKAR